MIKEEKNKLRQIARSKREEFAKNNSHYGGFICQSILANFNLKAQSAAIYYPVNSEVDLLSLAKKGNKTCLPIITKGSKKMQFAAYNAQNTIEKGEYGIPNPSKDAELVVPKIVFFPLIAFDKHKNRLGYGGGYYDATVNELEQKAKVFKVGVAYNCQEVERIPVEKHDIKLDAIITENRFVS